MSDFERIKKFNSERPELPLGHGDVQWLIVEVEKLRDARETLSKQAHGMIIVDDSKQIESLTKEKEEWRVRYNDLLQRMFRAPSTIDNAKLEAANTELKQTLKEKVLLGLKQCRELVDTQDELATSEKARKNAEEKVERLEELAWLHTREKK